MLFLKGYALIEYEKFEEAQNAISAMNGAELLTKTIYVDWAFSNGPSVGPYKRKNMRFAPVRTLVILLFFFSFLRCSYSLL